MLKRMKMLIEKCFLLAPDKHQKKIKVINQKISAREKNRSARYKTIVNTCHKVSNEI
jgi:hypothetical protein